MSFSVFWSGTYCGSEISFAGSFGENAETISIGQWMTLDVHKELQCEEDQILQGNCSKVDFLKILVCDMLFQNQILSTRHDNIHLTCQTSLMYDHSQYRVEHHQRHYHLVQKCFMTCIYLFESCLMHEIRYYKSLIILLLFLCQEKANLLLDNM